MWSIPIGIFQSYVMILVAFMEDALQKCYENKYITSI